MWREWALSSNNKRHHSFIIHHSLSLSVWHCCLEAEKTSEKKMSGTVKKVADATFKAGKSIDWDGMAKLLVSDGARKEFASLRRAFDEVNSSLQTKFSQVHAFLPLPPSFSTLPFFASDSIVFSRIRILLNFSPICTFPRFCSILS